MLYFDGTLFEHLKSTFLYVISSLTGHFILRLPVMCVNLPWTLLYSRDLSPSWNQWCSTVKISTRRWLKKSPLVSSSLICKGMEQRKCITLWHCIQFNTKLIKGKDYSFIHSSPYNESMVEVNYTFNCFFSFSGNRTDQDIQTYTIAVINALFLKAPEEKRQVQLTHKPIFFSFFHLLVVV